MDACPGTATLLAPVTTTRERGTLSTAVDLKAPRGPAGCRIPPTPTTTRATPPPSTNSEGVVVVLAVCLFCLCEK